LLKLHIFFLFSQIDFLKINPASIIEDYYGNSVQTRHALSPSDKKFEGKIVYQVAQSECAIYSQAAWVVLDPLSADADQSLRTNMKTRYEDEDKIVNAVEELVEEH